MTEDDLDPVWKALADPTRRALLDLLKGRPRMTGDLAAEFPHLSRFAVGSRALEPPQRRPDPGAGRALDRPVRGCLGRVAPPPA
jgi:hypothetical protein